MEARMREFEAQFEPVEDERYELLPEDYECDGEGNCNDEEAGNEGCFCYCGKEECKVRPRRRMRLSPRQQTIARLPAYAVAFAELVETFAGLLG